MILLSNEQLDSATLKCFKQKKVGRKLPTFYIEIKDYFFFFPPFSAFAAS